MTARDAIPEGRFPPADGDVAHLRTPPAAIEAERSVLGALLQSAPAWDVVGDMLQPGDFYRHEHRLVFEAIAALANACRPVDVVTVFDHLQCAGTERDAGGLPYLNDLAQAVPSASTARRYAEIVREHAVRRRVISACDEISSAAFSMGPGTSVEALVDEAGRKILAVEDQAGGDDDWVSMATLVVQQLDEIQERADGGDQRSAKAYIPTGLSDLDDLLDGGLRGGQLVIVGARPSMGKSALAKGIELHVAGNLGLAVGSFSMEMQNRENVQRAISATAHIPMHALRRPDRMSDLHWSGLTRGVEHLRNIPLFSNEKAGLNINQLRAKARKLRRRSGLSLLTVDYLQLMSGTDPRMPRHLQLEECTRGLKGLAKELDIPVIVLAQVNRGVEKEQDPMPRMSDLKDSGSIEQDADIIIFVHRPIVARPDLSDEWKRYAKCHLAKQRGGRTGTFHLHYAGEHTQFSDWPADLEVPTNPVRIAKSSRESVE